MSEAFAPAHELAASFRDPAGSLFRFQDRILRVVTPLGRADLSAFLDSSSGRKLMESGTVVPTHVLDEEESGKILSDPEVKSLFQARSAEIILEHEPVDFPSFPYEWAPEMLHAAALLTLDITQELLRDGLGLKDGTPYNVLFRGPRPVFIDLLSFERRVPGDPTWLPYAQFVRTFLLPLLANQRFGLALDQIFLTRRDGLEPEEVYRWAKPLQRLQPPFLGLVSLPAWLGSRHKQDDTSIYQRKVLENPEKARFILDSALGGLRRALRRVAPKSGKNSVWSDYMVSNNNYTADHFEAKQRFVRDALQEFGSRSVLDVGCNTGHFSRLAAKQGAKVVAVDYDPVVVGDVWRAARVEQLDILPLVVNLTRPSPSTGWRNRECPSFLDRARGKFDAVLMLAVIHHMLVTERVPLPDILAQAAELTTGILVIEFIAPDDSMFRRLTRGRDELHQDLTPAVFEAHCRRYFDIVRSQHVDQTSRTLYVLKRRP